MPSERLLLVGRATAPTGFARVLRTLAHKFAARGFEVVVFATDHGTMLDPSVEIVQIEDRNDVYGFGQLLALYERLKPHHTIIMRSEQEVGIWIARLEAALHRSMLYAYFPVEGAIVGLQRLQQLASKCTLVFYTQAALAGFLSALPAAVRSPKFVPSFVGHGVDCEAFYAVSHDEKATLRRKLFPERDLKQALLVLNANRNQSRKRWDITFCEFATFARERHDALLVVHSAGRSKDYDMRHLTQALNLNDRVLFTNPSNGPPSLEDHDLNEIYNACDIGINTAEHEGWGLIAFEHAATGSAQILSDSDHVQELWGNNVMRIGPGQCSSFASALDVLADRPARLKMAERAMVHARSDTFSWATCIDRWLDIFARRHSLRIIDNYRD